MNPDICPTCGQNWPDRQGRVCSLCGSKIGSHHKYRFVGSTVQHRDCSDPKLDKHTKTQQDSLLTEAQP
jgi:predicted amidophosphoribosyltransferase